MMLTIYIIGFVLWAYFVPIKNEGSQTALALMWPIIVIIVVFFTPLWVVMGINYLKDKINETNRTRTSQ